MGGFVDNGHVCIALRSPKRYQCKLARPMLFMNELKFTVTQLQSAIMTAIRQNCRPLPQWTKAIIVVDAERVIGTDVKLFRSKQSTRTSENQCFVRVEESVGRAARTNAWHWDFGGWQILTRGTCQSTTNWRKFFRCEFEQSSRNGRSIFVWCRWHCFASKGSFEFRIEMNSVSNENRKIKNETGSFWDFPDELTVRVQWTELKWMNCILDLPKKCLHFWTFPFAPFAWPLVKTWIASDAGWSSCETTQSSREREPLLWSLRQITAYGIRKRKIILTDNFQSKLEFNSIWFVTHSTAQHMSPVDVWWCLLIFSA